MPRTNKADEAVVAFTDGLSCSQAVFSAFAPEYGVDRETAARIASAFGGGMARSGNTCGAVTGACMAIGLARGGSRSEQREAKERAYELVREFSRRFGERHGALTCRELLGCVIGTPEGMAQARASGLFDTLCPNLVRDAVEILEEILAE